VRRAASGDVGSEILLLVSIALLIAAALWAAGSGDNELGRLIAYVVVYGACAPAASLICLMAQRAPFKHLVGPVLLLALGAVAAVAFAPYMVALWNDNRAAFQLGAVVGAMACLLAVVEARFKSFRLPIRLCSAAVIAVALVTTALVGPNVNGDLNWIMTFSVFLGPAIRVMAGGLPLIDTFSQYGILPFVLFAGMFSTVVAPSYPSSAFIVGLVNAAYILVALAIMARFVRVSVFVACAAGLLTIGIVPAWFGIPQNGGLRFLPPLLTAAALACQRREQHLSCFALATLLLASFWSIEAFTWSALTACCAVGGQVLYKREPILEFFRPIGSAALIIVGAHSAVSIFAYLGVGQWPRYDIYFDMVHRFRTSGWGAVPFSAETPLWIVEGTIYFVGLALAFTRILKPGRRGQIDDLIIGVVLPLAVTGLLGMSYWVGRPLEFSLWPTMVPAVILATIAIDQTIVPVQPGHMTISQGSYFLIASCVIVALSATMGVLSTSRHGFSDLVAGRDDPFHYAQRKIQLLKSLKATPAVPAAYDPIAWDAIELVRKYQPPQKDVVLFIQMPREVPVYLLTNHKDAFGLSSFGDNISPKFAAERREAVGSVVGPGTHVFIQKSFADYFWLRRVPGPSDWKESYTDLQKDAYKIIRDRYDLCILEESPNGMLATIARPKSDGSCSDVYDP
jgi:hypothetical protein